jgi:perosamine synthetase
MIPLCEPTINIGNAKKYVGECIDSNYVSSSGSFVQTFERRIAEYVGAKYAVAVSSGTAAMHLSLVVSGVGAYEEVIVPDITFVATANAVRYVGAFPVFMDCDSTYCQLDVPSLYRFLYKECTREKSGVFNNHTGRRVVAIIPVSLFGHPVSKIKEIAELAERFGLVVIEDAAQSFGSIPVGKHGGMACFSFNGNKIITCGGGGAVTTDSEVVANKIRHLSTQARSHPIEYIHNMVGFNYRMSNLHAALGCSQIEQITKFIVKKRNSAKKYSQELAPWEVRVVINPPTTYSNYWLSAIILKDWETRLRLYSFLRAKDIGVSPIWHPLSKLSIFEDCFSYCFEKMSLQFYHRALLLPSSVGLTEGDQGSICGSINEFFGR